MLVVLTGPSGVGKSTIEMVLSSYSDTTRVVSHTTRPPREGEIDGKEYHFVSEETFLEMKKNGDFAEYAHVHGNYYGLSHEEIDSRKSRYSKVIFVSDPQGAAQIKSQYPDAILLFIAPPSMDVLEKRINHRGVMDRSELDLRIADARDWIKHSAPFYDYIIINDDLERAIDDVRCIFRANDLKNAQLSQLLSQ